MTTQVFLGDKVLSEGKNIRVITDYARKYKIVSLSHTTEIPDDGGAWMIVVFENKACSMQKFTSYDVRTNYCQGKAKRLGLEVMGLPQNWGKQWGIPEFFKNSKNP